MTQEATVVMEDNVRHEWVDYNGHMNDAAYVKVFSEAIDQVLANFGLNSDTRQSYLFTVYTLENHVRYLKECHEGEAIRVTVQLVDHDSKRLHLFLTMQNAAGEELATSEQMLMGISTELGRAASFPDEIARRVAEQAAGDARLERPDSIGRSIGIKRH